MEKERKGDPIGGKKAKEGNGKEWRVLEKVGG